MGVVSKDAVKLLSEPAARLLSTLITDGHQLRGTLPVRHRLALSFGDGESSARQAKEGTAAPPAIASGRSAMKPPGREPRGLEPHPARTD
ncbi:unnamed protein product [Coccothraustes coccothraustes]